MTYDTKVAPLALLATAALAGCADLPNGEVQQAAQSLNASITFDSATPSTTCTPAQRATVLGAMRIAVDQILTNPAPMVACLNNAFVSPTHGGG
jgi:hypothetical protein